VATLYSVDEPFREDSIRYYRTLLRALYVVLRGIALSTAAERGSGKVTSPASIVTTTQTVLSVLDRVVALGFRSAVSLVHEVRTPAYAEDIALLTAILQACLSLPGLDESQGQILNIMAAQDVLAVATSLYSWSDRLNDKNDPVYGELSLLFLLEISSLPVIAEQLAIDGFLGQLTSAGIANYLRRPHVSPVSDSSLAVRCYGIWVKAILPLLLNVLTALGPSIAAEVAFVLNQFPNLLQSSVDRFDAPGLRRTSARNTRQYITLLSVSEIHSLALLTRVLAASRQNNARDIPAVEWDAGALLEGVDFWLSGRKVLRESLLPLGSREVEWKGMPASARRDCESRLEEKIVVQLEAVRDVLGDDLSA
jgi:nuclear pore complex protein Nup188